MLFRSVAVDISRSALAQCADQLAEAYPRVRIEAICADYTRGLQLPEPAGIRAKRRVIYFPGSTIGNFTPEEALQFLREARVVAGAGGAMLVGVDLKKDPARLHAAYNDAQGVTANFNLNLLERINRELDGTIPVEDFRHRAIWNDDRARIEMHLEAMRDAAFEVDGRDFSIAAGETIHTENSHKYGARDARILLRGGGWTPVKEWTDEEERFAVILAEAQAERVAP